MMATTTEVWVIGGGVGFDSGEGPDELSNWSEKYPNKQITNIMCGRNHTFFIDEVNQRYYVTQLYEPDSLVQEITFFKDNEITIKQLHISHTGGNGIFWIDDTGMVWEKGQDVMSDPIQVPALKNVIDMTALRRKVYALCGIEGGDKDRIFMLIQTWARFMPSEIANIILKYYCYKQIYTRKHDKYGRSNYEKWTALELDNTSPIVSLTSYYALEENSTIWAMKEKNIDKIDYFKERNIKIVAFERGLHCVAVTDEGKVYSWGDNSLGQCGHGNINHMSQIIKEPKLIEFFEQNKYKVIKMNVSIWKTYCMTECGKHFIFGRNSNNECLTNDGTESVNTPYCINDEIADKCGTGEIKLVSIGFHSTSVIVSRQQ